MSLQSPNSSSISTDQEGQGKNPAAAFGPNEWLVDEIYQQYLQDPNSVDRAWWDFFADYKPGGATAPSQPAEGSPAAPAAPAQSSAPAAAPKPAAAEPATPAKPAASAPAPAKAAPAKSAPPSRRQGPSEGRRRGHCRS